ncbi:MAG: HD domain-containing protein, partial [Treponema sp.]|nr:HD domain-containing protein [Treponema sp.]
QRHQLNFMLVLTGICASVAILVLFTDSMPKKQRLNVFLLELSAMLLLVSDRLAYLYRGDTSSFGWWMVRISNFLVFLQILLLIYFFNNYMIHLYLHEKCFDSVPKRLSVAKWILIAGIALLVASQFTGLYYTFDTMNRYHRAKGLILCYVFPLAALFLQLSIILQYYSKLNVLVSLPILMFTTMPVAATAIQFFAYGLSLTNLSIVGMSIVLYVFALIDLNATVQKARKREMELLKEEQNNLSRMFAETAAALASAIDAKDRYTHGHSNRVAAYSKEIAIRSGKNEKEVREIYFAALLHDVGKIGVDESIINKKDSLTKEEFDEIKKHTVWGWEILSKITHSPYLSMAAHYHHEKYNGSGYPEGLSGTNIPDVARIVAVADAYDAMTRKRS